MIDFLIPKFKHIALVTFLFCLPFPVLAKGSVEIVRYSTENDIVTLRVRVRNEEKVPIQGLTNENFTIQTTDNQGNSETLNPRDLDLISSQQTQPDPANLIILMDLSGSMKNEDLSGNVKLNSAVNAIQDFISQIKTEEIPVNLSIVPFGYGCSLSATSGSGKTIPIDLNVDATTIKNNLKAINNSALTTQLVELGNVDFKSCSPATNIYEPLKETVNYLGSQYPASSFTDKKQTELPKLAVILLSDGYDVYNQRRNESVRFEDLSNVLKENPHVTVHTMGYGEKLRELRNRINKENPGSCNLNDSQLSVENISKNCKLPQGGDINEYIVDEPRLTEIANLTGGIHKFPGNPQEVVDTLKVFLTTLREYEIQYVQPGAERAKKYPSTVIVNAPERELFATSPEENIRLDNFLFKALSWQQILFLLLLTALIIEGGRRYFLGWSDRLSKKSEGVV